MEGSRRADKWFRPWNGGDAVFLEWRGGARKAREKEKLISY